MEAREWEVMVSTVKDLNYHLLGRNKMISLAVENEIINRELMHVSNLFSKKSFDMI